MTCSLANSPESFDPWLELESSGFRLRFQPDLYNPTAAPRTFHLVGRQGGSLALELAARAWQLVDIQTEAS